MKKSEKIITLTTVIISLLCLVGILFGLSGQITDRRSFDAFGICFWLLVGSVTVLALTLKSYGIRKRVEAGKNPISPLYKTSFILSFLPLVLHMFIMSADRVAGALIMLILSPVYLVCFIWQIVYIINRVRYLIKGTPDRKQLLYKAGFILSFLPFPVQICLTASDPSERSFWFLILIPVYIGCICWQIMYLLRRKSAKEEDNEQ